MNIKKTAKISDLEKKQGRNEKKRRRNAIQLPFEKNPGFHLDINLTFTFDFALFRHSLQVE